MHKHWIGLLLIIWGLTACTTRSDIPTEPSIMVTFSVLGDITTNIVGDAVPVAVLVAADNDPHVFEPSPADIARLANASTVIELGLEFEPWFDDLYAASGSNAPRIVASTPITPLDAADHADETHADETHADETHADEHAHGEYDPHVWQDVQQVMMMVTYLTDELAQQYPEHAEAFRQNSQGYLNQLVALDSEIRERTAAIPEEQRILVTNHDSFGYFAAGYGYTVLDSILGTMSTEGGDPSAAQIAQLADRLREVGVPSIFVENTNNTQIAENLAREAGITIAPALYTDALGAADTPGSTYIGMMRYNMDVIATALQQP